MDGKNNMIIGIILAAGKGTRLKSVDRNKVTLPFLNKPLILYSVELMATVCDKTVVVVGAFVESVKAVLKNKKVIYAYQNEQLGTAHAVKVGIEEIEKNKQKPKLVIVGYGDHTMFYKKETVKRLVRLHQEKQAAVSLLTFEYDDPDRIKYGRIVRDTNGFVVSIVEHKDAMPEQRAIKEVNPGFYCFDYDFLKSNIGKIEKSPASGEYYITDMIKIAVDQGKKVVGLPIAFSEAGLGFNTAEELSESEKIYLQNK